MRYLAEERARLAVLESHGLLDGAADPELQRITALLARLCAAPIALVSLLGEDRQCFRARHGLDLAEAPPEAGFCREVVRSGAVLVVADALANPVQARNPMVSGQPHLRFFAGAPLRLPGGHVLGALCIADRRPRLALGPTERQVLQDLADVIAALFDSRQQAREALAAQASARLEADLLAIDGESGPAVALLPAALARICAATGARAGALWRLSPDGGLDPTAWHPHGCQPVRPPRPAEASPIGRALLHQRRQSIDLARSEPDGLPELAHWQSAGLKRLLVQPMMLDDCRCALTLLFDRPPDPLDWLVDVPEALQAMLARHAAGQRARVVSEALDAVNDSLLVLEPAPVRAASPRILYASAAVSRQTGWKPEEILGATPALFFGPHPDLRGLAVLRAGMRQGRRVRAVLPLRRRDGTLLEVEAEVTTVLDPEGAPLRHIAVQRPLGGETQRGPRRQDRRLAAIRRIAGGLAQDVNDLFSAIMLNLSEAVDQAPEMGELREQLDAALFAASRGAELTGQLLAYAQRQPLHPARVELQEAVAGFVPLLCGALGELHALEAVPEADGAMVEIDAQQLEAAVMQLVLNARAAMPAGGTIRLHVGRRVIAATAPAIPDPIPAGRYVGVSVEDHGIGIPAGDLRRACEPFFTSRTKGASGLGLSMAYGFARQSGGWLDLHSRVDEGTRVELLFPEQDAEAPYPSTSNRMPWASGKARE